MLHQVEIGAPRNEELCIPSPSPRNKVFTELFQLLKKYVVTETADCFGV